MKRRFNDDYYAVPVEEWEGERIPQVILDGQLTWIPVTAITGWFAVGQFVSNHGWAFWLAYAAGVYLVSSLFVLLTEVNENVRYVRHQLRTFRDAIRKTNEQIQKYQRPEHATADDILNGVDREMSP